VGILYLTETFLNSDVKITNVRNVFMKKDLVGEGRGLLESSNPEFAWGD